MNLPDHSRSDGEDRARGGTFSREDLVQIAQRRRAASADSDLLYYWKVLFGRRWMIAAATMLGFTVAAVLTLRQPRLYQAQATVEFKQPLPPGKDLRLVDPEVSMPPALAVRLLTTKILAARVIEAEREKGMHWFDPVPVGAASGGATFGSSLRGVLSSAAAKVRMALGGGPPAQTSAATREEAPDVNGVDLGTIGRYYGHVSIRPVSMTSLADIVVTDADPGVAAQVANDHAQAFMDLDLATKAASLSDAQSLFAQQLQEVKGKVESSRQALSDFQRQNGILSLPKDNTTIARESLQQLNTLLTQTQGERIVAEANFRNAASMTPEELAQGLPDASLEKLREELLALKAKYDGDLEHYGRNHPDMIAARAKIQALEERLRQAGLQAREHLSAVLEVAQAKERELRENFDKLSKTAGQEDKQLVQLLILQRDVDSNQQLYTTLLQQTKEADLTTGGFRWTSVKLVDRAVVPVTPSYPATRRDLGLGLLLGFLAGAFGCLLLDRLDMRIHTPDDVVEVLQLPAFGLVPDFRRLNATAGYGQRPLVEIERVSAAGKDLVTLLHPASLVSEAYRGIRTNLMFASPGRPPRSILVTSSQANEGKTVTTINLAVSLALSGSKVLIVDADFRKPGCHGPMKVAHEPGLSNVLTGQCDLAAAVVRSPLFPNGNGSSNGHGLYVLPAGTLPPNPAELLGSGVMSSVLDQLGKQFDFVLVDSPPVLAVTDSIVIATKTDGVLMVVRGGEWGRDVVQRALSQLEAVRANILGVVLNRVDLKRGGSASYYYRHYDRGYYGEPAAEERREV